MGKLRPVAPLALAALALAGQAAAQNAAPPTPAPDAPKPAAVSGLTVTAVRPKSQTELDRKVYVISGNLQGTTGSAADVLNEVPSVDVDADGNVTLRGDSHVTILVDGKPSAQFAGASLGVALQQFPASDIDRIEVLTNPPAQYRAEGSAGVINIVTRKTRQAGLSGALRATAGLDGRFVTGLDASYNAGPLKLSAGAGFRVDVRDRISTSDRTETDPVSLALTKSFERIDEHFRRPVSNARAAIDWRLDKTQSLGASFSANELNGHRSFDQADVGGPPGQAIDTSTTRHSDGREWHLDASEEAHFEQKLWRPDETLKLQFQRSWTRERERYFYINAALLPPGPNTFDDLFLSNDLVTTEFSADYDLPMADKRDLKLGYDLEEDVNAFDNLGHSFDPISGLPVVNPNVTDHFRYRQTLNSVYGSYDAPVGKWRLQAGVRAEWSSVAFQALDGSDAGARRDFGAFPSLSLERSLGESGKLLASLSRRVTWPDPEALNPFADHQDTHNLRAGNPNLLPQDTWSGQVGYSHSGALSWGADLYYRLDKDSVTDVLQPLGNGVVLATKANLPKSQSAGLEFNASGKLARQLSFDLSGEAFNAQIDARVLGFAGLRSTEGLNLKASLDWRPTSADQAQISFSRADRRLTPQGGIAAINLVNIGLKHQLRPDLALVFTLSNAFDGQKFRRVVTTPTLTDNYLRYQIGRIAYIGAVWTFGGPAKGKGAAFEYESGGGN